MPNQKPSGLLVLLALLLIVAFFGGIIAVAVLCALELYRWACVAGVVVALAYFVSIAVAELFPSKL